MDSHINVTFVAGGAHRDLRIPTSITVQRLVDELAEIFPGMTAGLRKYQLRVRAKGLLLEEEDVLAIHPVTTGDVVELISEGSDD